MRNLPLILLLLSFGYSQPLTPELDGTGAMYIVPPMYMELDAVNDVALLTQYGDTVLMSKRTPDCHGSLYLSMYVNTPMTDAQLSEVVTTIQGFGKECLISLVVVGEPDAYTDATTMAERYTRAGVISAMFPGVEVLVDNHLNDYFYFISDDREGAALYINSLGTLLCYQHNPNWYTYRNNLYTQINHSKLCDKPLLLEETEQESEETEAIEAVRKWWLNDRAYKIVNYN